jgi:ubiquinone/menaquinone biosynthesis C-methylase UbiE
MELSTAEWHQRFLQQARWTESVRRYLLSRMDRKPGFRILETGCGTGAVTQTLEVSPLSNRYGIDWNLKSLQLAQRADPVTSYTAGDAYRLPFASHSMDAVVCHYFLLWIADPRAVLAEMMRVTRPGGWVMAFAEPDYGGRIDHPAALVELGQLQRAALKRQGADPEMGRKLSGLFHAAGLQQIETGLLGGQWSGNPDPDAIEMEWKILSADLSPILPKDQIEAFKAADAAAWQSGDRVLFLPTFYGMGRKS